LTDFNTLFAMLSETGVEYVLVGGLAATVHGSSRLTQDVDVVYRRTDENLDRLQRALEPLRPYPRGAPPGLPFEWSAATLKRGLNFTLTTAAGPIDLLGELVGGGSYESLADRSVDIELFGRPVRCIDIDALIEVKRAAGRPKDYEVIAELELLREERSQYPAAE